MASSPKSKAQIWRVLTVILAFLLTFSIGATVITSQYANKINGFLNISGSKLVETGDPTETQIYYESDYSSAEEVWEHNSDVAKRLEAEGAALLKNENSALPLSKGAKVTVFGRSSVDLVKAKDSNSGGTNIDLKEQFEANGMLSVNPVLYEAYKNCGVSGTRVRNPGGFGTAMPTVCNVLEAPMSVYTEEVRDSYESYGDAAIVVISRDGGEGADPNPDIAADGDQPYLELQTIEKEMIREASSNFDKVILLVNTSNMIGLNELDELGVDACIWIGGPGGYGMYAVAEMLVGEINPSGKLANIYAASSLSSPAMQNFGDFTFSNTDDLDSALQEAYGGASNAGRYSKYVVYAEGIYVGYKYYETRYEDAVLGQGNASSAAGTFASASSWDYDEEVCFPFGYGLSYTQFTQELEGVRETEDTFEVTVKVTNSGGVPGRSVVQVYAQTPYTDFDKENGIEVASVELVGFDKTEELAANASEEVVISVDKEDLTHYDPFVNKTFIMEAGDYYLAVGDNAHDAVNNILAAKGKEVGGDAEQVYSYTLAQTDTQTYAVTDGNVMITNQFDDVDLNYYIDGAVTYLSRSDWNATWPEEMNDLSANAAMIEALDAEGNYEAGSADMSEYVIGADTDYTVAMMIGAGFDDPHWNDIINQMSIEDLVNLCARSGLNMIESISYPAAFMKDGSHRVTDRSYVERPGTYAHIMPSVVIMAQSFDRELLYQIGLAFGEDNIRTATVGHYAPGVNIHRTPYSGRNFEYYSEDAFLSGEMSVPAIQGMQEKGAITYLKHFLGNEQETNRNGVSTFMSQQAMREVYLEAFKAGITEGKTKGIMGGFNRIGCTWTGAHYGLMTEVLRGEFEWTGIADTDAVFGYSPYMGFKCGLMAGTTMWATSGTGVYDAVIEDVLQDAQLVGKLREASHYLLYNVVNSLAFNGISQDSRVVPVTPYWEVILYVIIGVLSVVTVGSAAMVVVGTVQGGKKKEVNG